MGNFDRFYDQPREYVSFESAPIRPKERVMRLPGAIPTADTRGGSGTVLDLVYQAAAVIKGIENQAIEAAKEFQINHINSFSWRESALRNWRQRSEPLNSGLAKPVPSSKESDEAARVERARLEAAERKMCELEMRARKAEAHAKENANAVARIEEAIRTQLLEKRLPPNKLALSA